MRDRDGAPYTLLLIAGAGRSGSTLFELILDQVPGVVAVGELTEIWDAGLIRNERCGCGEPFDACPFWTEVGERAFGGWENCDPRYLLALHDDVARNRWLPALLAVRALPRTRRRADEYAAVLARILDAVAAVSGCQVIVDASKWPSHAMILRRIDGVDLRMAHLVRDPRGVAYSWGRELERPHAAGAGAEAGRGVMRRDPVARSAAHWTWLNVGVELIAALGVPRYFLRYEDMVAAPRESVAAVLGYAGHEPGEGMLDYIQGRQVHLSPGHGIAGNPSRFRQGDVQLEAGEQWREALTPRARATIGALTAPLDLVYRRRGGASP